MNAASNDLGESSDSDSPSSASPIRVCHVVGWIEQSVPRRLAEDWDNVGLLVGRRSAIVRGVTTCLTLTPDVVDEVIRQGDSMVIAHHPLPFRPMAKITDDDPTGQICLRLIESSIAVYSPHTAWDSAAEGINATWARRLDVDASPLIPDHVDESVGGGRIGVLKSACDLDTLCRRIASVIPHTRLRVVRPCSGTTRQQSNPAVKKVVIACGSGGSFVGKAIGAGADAIITGEATYHQCLEAKFAGLAMVMVGHFASEKFAMGVLAKRLSEQFAGLRITDSTAECDPVSDAGV